MHAEAVWRRRSWERDSKGAACRPSLASAGEPASRPAHRRSQACSLRTATSAARMRTLCRSRPKATGIRSLCPCGARRQRPTRRARGRACWVARARCYRCLRGRRGGMGRRCEGGGWPAVISAAAMTAAAMTRTPRPAATMRAASARVSAPHPWPVVPRACGASLAPLPAPARAERETPRAHAPFGRAPRSPT